MPLSWQLGTFEIALRRFPQESGEHGAGRWEAGDRETRTVTGLVGGAFGIHRATFGAWTLSATSCGFRIADAADLIDVLRLAERIADLDWSGTPTETGRRNSSAVWKAMKELNL